jgi:hypothetical protein
MSDAELPRDADGFDVLPCGCRMKTAVIADKPTFLFKPCALDCPTYAYVLRENSRQGKEATTIDMRRRRG